MANFVGYIRVSTDAQRDNTSLEIQERAIKLWCEQNGHNLVRVYKDIYSGATTKDRPEFQKAIKQLSRVDGIIAYKLDRVARNARDILALVEDIIQPKGKALVLLDINIDTSKPIGKAMLTVLATVAALERDMIRERTQGGRIEKANKGGYAFGAPAYGQKAESKSLKAEETELAVIKQIWNYRQGGLSLRRICKLLNDREVKSKHGKQWWPQAVLNVLKRRARNN